LNKILEAIDMGMPKGHVVCVSLFPAHIVSEEFNAHGAKGLKAHEDKDVRVKEIKSI
jgi:hypothetical protein